MDSVLARSRVHGGIALLSLLIASSSLAQSLPQQLVFPPIPVAPLDFEGPAPTSFALTGYHFPDNRRGESYELAHWVRIGDRHSLRVGVSYVGIEASELAQHGGGPFRFQWTSHSRPLGQGGFAVDLVGEPPMGDKQLHPLSAGAPSAQGRVRYSPGGNATWRLWVGYWTRRVSPPEERDRPLSAFPSGSGFDATLRVHQTRWAAELVARQDLAGLPDQTWVSGQLEWKPAADVGLFLAGATSLGPTAARLVDLSWQVGLKWYPTPISADDG